MNAVAVLTGLISSSWLYFNLVVGLDSMKLKKSNMEVFEIVQIVLSF